MTLKKATEELNRQYERAKQQKYIRKPLAYALYHTWRMADEREKPREVHNEYDK